MTGRFVEIDLGLRGFDVAEAQVVARSCPVDIYGVVDDALVVRAERVDECILCGRCVSASDGQVTVRRAYGSRQPVAGAVDG